MLKASPFLGEGHRKVKARLAAKGIRVGKNRVLRRLRRSYFVGQSEGKVEVYSESL